MRKAGRLLLLLSAALLLLCGCGREKKEENEYTVYYVNTSGTRLMESRYVPAAETFDELMEELLEQMKLPPSGAVSVLKDGVSVNGYERGIDALRIDFSKEYYDLGNTDEVLLRAAVVKTFSQIPGAAKVMITVEKEQLCDAEGQPVPAMDAESFINTKEGGINSYLYAKLSLYFMDKKEGQLTRETRPLHYSSNMVLERVVLEQLIEGPKQSGLSPVLAKTTKIQNLSVRDGVCTVSFDSEANKDPSNGSVSPQMAVEAIVDSISRTCDEVEEVCIQIDGDSTEKFRGEVDLRAGFVADFTNDMEG